MTLRQFRGLLERRPFVPFQLAAANGEQFRVLHPDDAFFSTSSVYISVDIDDGIPFEFRSFSLGSVNQIEPIDGSPFPVA